MRDDSETVPLLGCLLYGVLVIAGMAICGLVLAPALGRVSGLFAVPTDALAFFGMLTLKSMPYIFSLGVASAVAYRWLGPRSTLGRVGAYAANVGLGYALAATVGALT